MNTFVKFEIKINDKVDKLIKVAKCFNEKNANITAASFDKEINDETNILNKITKNCDKEINICVKLIKNCDETIKIRLLT